MITNWLNKPAYMMTPLDNFLTWLFAVVVVGLIALIVYGLSKWKRR